MANNFISNPIQIDTAGEGITKGQFITGVIVIANADNWSCILRDSAAGNVIFRADSNLTGHRSIYFAPAEPRAVSGIYASTLANIALILIYVKSRSDSLFEAVY